MNKKKFTALGYAALIIALSSIPGRSFPTAQIFTYDKVIHLVEYAGFAIVLIMALPDVSNIWIVAAVAALFGMGDELYQSLIPGRDASLADWIADSMGILISVFAYQRWQSRK